MPPQQPRLCAGHVICRLKFARFCGGFCRCSDFAWHGRDFAQASSDFMQPRADFAQSRGDFAQPCTDFAQIYGDFTQPRVDFAQVRGDFAQARGDFERCCLQSSCLCTGFYEYQCVFLCRFLSFFSFLSCECPPGQTSWCPSSHPRRVGLPRRAGVRAPGLVPNSNSTSTAVYAGR